MDEWAMVIAVTATAAPAAIFAYCLRSRQLFWIVLAAAAIGLFFRPLEDARYSDPLIQLMTRTKMAMQGTVSFGLVGLLIALIRHRHRNDVEHQMTPEESHHTSIHATRP